MASPGALKDQIVADLHGEVAGRVNKPEHIEFWEKAIKAPPPILKILREGFKVCFDKGILPKSVRLRNNKSAQKEQEFVDLSIQRMVAIGICSESKYPPYVSNPLSVVDTGKKRLVLDVSRTINPVSLYKKVDLGSLHTFNENVVKGDYMAILDIKNAYYHYKVAKEHKKFFGFTWKFQNGKERYFHMEVLFLGINRAVQYFHDMTRPIIAYCQKNGVPLVAYLDDFRTTAHSYEKCQSNLKFVKDTLEKAGFILNQKSSTEPKQVEKFLGIINNFKDMVYQMPEKKKEKYKSLLEKILNTDKVTLKTLAEINGKLAHMMIAAGPVISLLTRELNIAIAENVQLFGWDKNPLVTVTVKLKIDLHRIYSMWESLDNYPIKGDDQVTPTYIMGHDASDNGFNVVEVKSEGSVKQILRYPLSEEEKKLSSTAREATALLHFLQLKGKTLKDHKIQTFTDSQVLELALTKGSRSVELQGIMLQIFDELRKNQISLKAVWLPRAHPILANIDIDSRFSVQEEKEFDQDSWGFSDDDLQFIIQKFKKLRVLSRSPQLDVFASRKARRFEFYYSAERDPKSLGQNAFNFIWTKSPCFICPPIRYINTVIKHAIACRIEGILTIPMWPSRTFWPLICQDGRHLNNMFAEAIFPFKPIFVNHGEITSTMFKGESSFDWIILYFNSKCIKPLESKVKKERCIENGCLICK